MPQLQTSPHELQEGGRPVIVNCGVCDRQIWTDSAYYFFPEDAWLCKQCVSEHRTD
jgi:hypothetical protein